MKEKLKNRIRVESDIKKELEEIEKILKSDEPQDVKFRSVRAIFNELSEEIFEAKVNAMFESRTGLLSSSFGEEALAKEVEQAKRTGNKFCVTLMDIDFLKYINDNYGHVVGTKVIVEVARAIKEKVRKYDIVCRYGGDEFLIVFPNTDITKAKKIVGRIKSEIEQKVFEKKVKVTLSIGVVECCSDKRVTVEKILKKADKNLYEAKKIRTNVNLK